jgi:hypothetical protein
VGILGSTAVALTCSSCSAGAEEENPVDRVKAAFASSYGIDSSKVDVEVGEVVNDCRYFSASTTAVTDVGSQTFVVLPDSRLFGKFPGSLEDATAILRTCSTGQSATQWALDIVDFSGVIYAGPITDPATARDQLATISAAGLEFFAPQLTTTGDSTVVKFYARNVGFTAPAVHYVEAKLPAAGTLEVAARKL